MSRRPTILLVIPHLGGGGAEHVVSLLAGGLNPERFEVHLAIVTQRDSSGFRLPEYVTVHGLGSRRVRAGWFKLLWLVRRLRPDVILSGMAHLNLLLLILRPLFPRKTKVLVRQNGCIRAEDKVNAYRTLYPRADAVVCQTTAMAADLGRLARLNRTLRVLPNPVEVDTIRELARTGPSLWTGPGPHLLAVGRLAPEKGFDLLLQAFVKVRCRFPSADLVLVGEGREKAALDMIAWLLGIRAAVHLVGHVDVPAVWLPAATLFVLSSPHDALPNAMLEAAAGGLPLVSTPASTGIVDLLRGQAGVWIAEDVSADALAQALLSALEQLEAGCRFAHDWVNAFSKERAIAAYESLLNECVAEPVR